jgi:hypothetical protein
MFKDGSFDFGRRFRAAEFLSLLANSIRPRDDSAANRVGEFQRGLTPAFQRSQRMVSA